jgi:hypothetical protein
MLYGITEAMMLPLLLLLQSPATTTGPTADRPIRVWMDAAGPVSRGRGVRLYVQAATGGNLVVLHSRTDGRIEVLFPARPTDDPHVTAGTWEVRGPGDGPVWTVSEPDGSGMILAALTPDPVWFDEFSHAASWDPDALRPSWSGADAAGGMQDIVQRMLGDGGFTYDVLTYTVAPAAIALAEPQTPDTGLTPPTIDNTEPNLDVTTCGVTVECGLLGEPLFLGRSFRQHRFSRPLPSEAPSSAAPTSAVASMVFPIHPAPLPSQPGPIVPRRRMIPDIAVRTLASRPVPGADRGRLAGAAPSARSALVLRYVRPPVVTPAPEVPGASLAPAAALSRPAPVGTVAAAMPMRTGGLMLMSRAGPSRATAPVTRAAPRTAVPQTHGTTGGWMVAPVRPRGR